MSAEDASKKSILFAFVANLGVAITKTVATVITGSGSMLAEAVHSYADCANQGLLFLGLKQSKKAPDENHPLGYGKEIFFSSFIVAMMLFSMGGVFSVYEGVNKLSNHEGVSSPMVAVVVLLIGMALEGAALYGCIQQIRKVKRPGVSLLEWSKHSRQSELVVILAEDTAALLGLFFALIAVVLTAITGNPIYDALGSIAIGVLLLFVSIFLGKKVKGLLVGQSAEKEVRDEIDAILESRPEIAEIFSVITLQLGNEIMVSIKARMRDVESDDELIHDINACEKALIASNPAIRWVFFEPDVEAGGA